MADLDPALIQKAARAICLADGQDPDGMDAAIICDFDSNPLPTWQAYEDEARAALLSLGIPAAALNAIAKGEAVARAPVIARPLDEWHEDFGPALWWFFPLCEPPYVGSPLDDDWPGYHTHWTPIECPSPPAPTGVSHDPRKRR